MTWVNKEFLSSSINISLLSFPLLMTSLDNCSHFRRNSKDEPAIWHPSAWSVSRERFPRRFSAAGKYQWTVFFSPISISVECFGSHINLRQFYISREENFLIISFNLLSSFCAEKWDGSALLMGTMYSFDIFAAMPCCTERLKVSERWTRADAI